MPGFGRPVACSRFSLFGLGVSAVLAGWKANPYSLPLLIAGILLILLAAGMIVSGLLPKKAVPDPAFEAWKERLRREGLRVEADLERAEILSNDYREATTDDAGSPVALYTGPDLLVDRDPAVYQETERSRIVVEGLVSGQKRRFVSPLLRKDAVTLRFQLAGKKTFIYVDAKKPQEYFFDLDFLNAEDDVAQQVVS